MKNCCDQALKPIRGDNRAAIAGADEKTPAGCCFPESDIENTTQTKTKHHTTIGRIPIAVVWKH